jgi:VanZ family protein
MNRSRTAAHGHGPIRHRGSARRSRLVSYLGVGYTLLVAYATLYPFRSWRAPVDGPFSFILAAWPRYYTFFELLVNVLAYLPLGFLLALTALPWMAPRWAAIGATLAGTASAWPSRQHRASYRGGYRPIWICSTTVWGRCWVPCSR